MPSKSIDINAALSFGWQTTLKNLKFFVPLYLAIIVISVLLGSLNHGSGRLGTLLSTVFGLVIAANIYHVTVMYADGKAATWSDLWTLPIERLLRYVGSEILINILVCLGFIFLIVPGVYLALRFSQVKYLIIEQGSGVWQALDESGRLTQGLPWSLLGLFIVEFGIVVAGIMTFVVGLLIAIPVVYLVNAHVYRQLTDSVPVAPSEPVLSL